MARNSYACAALCLASAVSAAATPSFTSIEITSLAGPAGNISAVALNGHGDIVGNSSYLAGGSGPFVYYHASRSEVALDGFAVGGINDFDKIAGEAVNLSTGPYAVEWSKNGGVLTLPSGGMFSEAGAVSNNGTIIGNVDNGHADNLAVEWTIRPSLQEHYLGVLWEDPTLPDYATSTASAINGLSHITGSSTAGSGTDFDTAQFFGLHAFIYRGGKMTDLGALALAKDGSDDSRGTSINDLDEVVGISTTAIAAKNSLGQACPDCGVASHAFLWRSGKMTDLGNLAGIPGWDSQADGIDDRGEIVGWSDSLVSGSSTHRAFLYEGGQMLNLQFYVYDRDPNVRLTEAVGINCQGWIVANGFNVNTPDQSRTYLLIRRGPSRPECALPLL